MRLILVLVLAAAATAKSFLSSNFAVNLVVGTPAKPRKPIVLQCAAQQIPVSVARSGYTDVLALLPDKGRLLYAAGTSRADVRQTVEYCVVRTTGVPRLWLSAYCYDEARSYQPHPDKATLGVWSLPDEQWEVFRRNFAWLCQESQALGVFGVVLDGEPYPLTPGGNGGQTTDLAWKDSPTLRRRAGEFGALLYGRKPGVYGHCGDLMRHTGFKRWWARVFSAHGGTLFGEDSFYGGGSRYDTIRNAAGDLHAQPSGGFWNDLWFKLPVSGTVAALRERQAKCGSAWWYDPAGNVGTHPDAAREIVGKL